MEFLIAKDIQKNIKKVTQKTDLPHINPQRIICFRSIGSKSRASARIWSLPKIWQQALKVQAHYCIEVLAPRFDRLSEDEQTKVLIHELLHIPKNFSGALLPHRSRKRYGINRKNIEEVFRKYKDS